MCCVYPLLERGSSWKELLSPLNFVDTGLVLKREYVSAAGGLARKCSTCTGKCVFLVCNILIPGGFSHPLLFTSPCPCS